MLQDHILSTKLLLLNLCMLDGLRQIGFDGYL
jgi:hypothetical protein